METGTRHAAGKNLVPDGWRLVRLGDVLKLEYGYSLPEQKRSLGPVPCIGSAGVVGYNMQATNDGPDIGLGRCATHPNTALLHRPVPLT